MGAIVVHSSLELGQQEYQWHLRFAQPLHSHAKIFFRIREQGVGVIPKIKQSHFIVI